MRERKIIALEGRCPTSEELKGIRNKLQKDVVAVLAFRDCTLSDKEFKMTLKCVASCRNCRHLSLCVDQVTDSFRVQILAQAIARNISLSGLHLYGNPISDTHVCQLQTALYHHPRLLTLDFGDCQIGDEGVAVLATILKDTKDRHGLRELILSHNTGITQAGWTRLAMALASGSSLRTLHVDYNRIGDTSARCLVTALPGATHMQTFDLECTGLTEVTGQLILNLLKNYRLEIKALNLKRNTGILKSTKTAIKLQINQPSYVEDELYNKQHDSDGDDQSLTVSEPPLDSQFQDYARRSSVNVIDVNKDESDQNGHIHADCDSSNVSYRVIHSRSAVEMTQNSLPHIDLQMSLSLQNSPSHGTQNNDFESHLRENHTTKQNDGGTIHEKSKQEQQVGLSYPRTPIDVNQAAGKHVLQYRPTSAPMQQPDIDNRSDTGELKNATQDKVSSKRRRGRNAGVDLASLIKKAGSEEHVTDKGPLKSDVSIARHSDIPQSASSSSDMTVEEL